jgi:hypothetical protein
LECGFTADGRTKQVVESSNESTRVVPEPTTPGEVVTICRNRERLALPK